jgi:hypothetical protein
MLTFLRHIVSTKGSMHAVERSFEIIRRFSLGGRRLDGVADLIESTLDPREMRMTFFVTAGVMQRHRHRIERLHNLGHDIGSHGLHHSRLDLLPLEYQSHILRESHRILTDAGFTVHGFRSPYLNYDQNTREALDQSPFSWTSGKVIFWNQGLRDAAGMERLEELYNYSCWDQRLSLPDMSRRVIDLPISAPDDEILYERYRVRAPKDLYHYWMRVFEHIHSCGEMFNLLIHAERFLQINGAVGALVDHVRRSSPPVWCPTLDELADWWRRRSAWSWHRTEGGGITIDAPAEATVLVKESASKPDGPESHHFYRNYHTQPDTSTYPPFTIGLSSKCPPTLRECLHREGFFVEHSASPQEHSLFLDRPDFKDTHVRKLFDEIDACNKPLLRLWRWPHACRSAFCISGDVCAIDLRDFLDRMKHFDKRAMVLATSPASKIERDSA